MAPAVPTTPTLYMLVVHWMQGMTEEMGGEGGEEEGERVASGLERAAPLPPYHARAAPVISLARATPP